MGKRIVFTRPDGGVSVITPADPDADLSWVATETLAKSGYGPTSFEIIEEAELPTRRWRNAWRQSGKTVAIDVVEAKKIRAAELERLVHGFDVLDKDGNVVSHVDGLLDLHARKYMIATAKGDDAAALAARQKVQALAALDKTALEASVVAVEDLDTLDKHEPQPIKDAKPVKTVVTDGVTVEPR